jgi:hypothetical protein
MSGQHASFMDGWINETQNYIQSCVIILIKIQAMN